MSETIQYTLLCYFFHLFQNKIAKNTNTTIVNCVKQINVYYSKAGKRKNYDNEKYAESIKSIKYKIKTI